MSLKTIIILTINFTLSTGHYNLGLCRSHLVQGVYNNTVTLQELVLDGDYTVLYTSGLKQLEDVKCARMGYVHIASTNSYKYYSYIEKPKKKEGIALDVTESSPGKFNVTLESKYDTTIQYVLYHVNGVLLVYWCKTYGDDNYFNNIWIVAAKSNAASLQKTKIAVLDMLYHDDYRHLVDSDIEEFREESLRYLKLLPCHSTLSDMKLSVK